MDAVITFVDGTDAQWQQDYNNYINSTPLTKRYRDWGLLKYLLRGIEVNMPFIDDVFLVVSGPGQVPSWCSDELKIVLHKDIIPSDFLPTFNSTTIEMFLHKIQGLCEQFIYFNDDIFPVEASSANDFFFDGKVSLRFSRHFFAGNLFKIQTKKSDAKAREVLGLQPSCFFLRPQHICKPMFKSETQEAFAAIEKDLKSILSRTRTIDNLSQYYFSDYLYHKGLVNKGSAISSKHFSLAVTSAPKLCSWLKEPSRKFVCINDVTMDDARYLTIKEQLISSFEALLPNRSRFEK